MWVSMTFMASSSQQKITTLSPTEYWLAVCLTHFTIECILPEGYLDTETKSTETKWIIQPAARYGHLDLGAPGGYKTGPEGVL